MAEQDTRVTYKAIADFAALVREAAKAQAAIRAVKDEEAALNAQSATTQASQKATIQNYTDMAKAMQAARKEESLLTEERKKTTASAVDSARAVTKAVEEEVKETKTSTEAKKAHTEATKAEAVAESETSKEVNKTNQVVAQATALWAKMKTSVADARGEHKALNTVLSQTSEIWGKLSSKSSNIWDKAKTGVAEARVEHEKFNKVLTETSNLWGKVTSGTDKAVGLLRSTLGRLGEALDSVRAKSRAYVNDTANLTSVFDNVRKGGEKLSETMNKIGGSAGRPLFIVTAVMGLLGLVNPAVAAIGSLGGALIGLAANLGSVAGIALTAAPALFTVVSALGSVKTATAGVGSAFQAWGAWQQSLDTAKTPLDKWNEALKKLSPSAQDFVKQMVGMKDAWTGLQQSVQESFFSKFVGGVQNLTKLFVPLKSMMGDTAGAMGNEAQKFIEQITSPAWLKDIQSLGPQNAAIITRVGDGLMQVLDVFKDLSIIAGPTLVKMATNFAVFADHLGNIVAETRKTGSLSNWLDNIYNRMLEWWQIVKNIGATIINYSTAASNFGQWITNSFLKMTQDWVKSSEDAMKPNSTYKRWLEDIKPLLKSVNDLLGGFWGWLTKTSANKTNIQSAADTLRSIRDTLGPDVNKVLQSMTDSGISKSFVDALDSIATSIATIIKNGGGESMKSFFDTIAGFLKIISGIVSNPVFGPALNGVISALGGFVALSMIAKFTGLLGLFDMLLKMSKTKEVGVFLDKLTAANASSLASGGPGVTKGGLIKGAATTIGVGMVAGSAMSGVNANSSEADKNGAYAQSAIGGAMAGSYGGPVGMLIGAGVGMVQSGFQTGKFQGGARQIQDFANQYGGGIGDKFAGGAKQIGTAVDTISNGVGKGPSDLGGKFAGGAQQWGDAFAAVQKQFKVGGDQIGSAVAGLIEKFKGGGGQIGSAFSGLIEKFKGGGGQIGSAFSGLIEKFKTGGSQIKSAWDGLIEKFKTGGGQIKGFGDDLWKGIQGIGPWLKKQSDGFHTWLTVDLPKQADKVGDKLWKGIQGIGPWLKKQGDAFYKWISEDLPKSAGHNTRTLWDGLQNIGKWLDKQWTAFQKWCDGVPGKVSKALNKVWDGITDINKWLDKQYHAYQKWCDGVPAAVAKWLGKVWDGIGDINKWLDKQWAKFQKWCESLPGAVGGWLARLWTQAMAIDVWLALQFIKFQKWASGVPGAVGGWLARLWTQAMAIDVWLALQFIKFQKWASGVPSAVGAWLVGIWNHIIGIDVWLLIQFVKFQVWASGIAGKVGGWLAGLWNGLPGFGTWLGQRLTELRDWAVSLPGKIAGWVGNLFGKIATNFNIGFHLPAGGGVIPGPGGTTTGKGSPTPSASASPATGLTTSSGRPVNRGMASGGGLMPQYFASGGVPSAINRPGFTTGFAPVGTDTVPAMLTPGEFVIRKYIVDKVGVENLERFNAGTASFVDMLQAAMRNSTPEKSKGTVVASSGGGISLLNGRNLAPTPSLRLPGVTAPSVANRLNSASTGSAPYFNVENLNIMNPVPETASDSLPRSIRKMVHLSGGSSL